MHFHDQSRIYQNLNMYHTIIQYQNHQKLGHHVTCLLTRFRNTMAQFILVLACCQLRYSFTLA